MADSSTMTNVASLSLAFDVFAKNAYRVLGLKGSATAADLRNATASFRRANKLGVIKETEWDLDWLGPISRTNIDIQGAESKLQDPETRVLERFFWFHEPTLDCDLVPEQCAKWLQSPTPWSLHDVAVLRTVSAGLVDPQFRSPEVWNEVVETWVAVADCDDYWLCLFDADEEAQFEPAITSGEVIELQATSIEKGLDCIVLSIRLALSKGDTESAARASSFLQHKVLPLAAKDYFLNQIFEPIESLLIASAREFKADCLRNLRRDENNSPADTAFNKKQCELLKKQFDTKIQPILDQVSSMANSDSESLRRCMEEAAECLSSLANANTWADRQNKSIELLQKASDLVDDSSVATVINERLSAIRSQVDFAESLQDDLDSYLLDFEYEIILPRASYTTISVCSCCLGESDSPITLTHTWEENYIAFKRVKSLSFELPYCSACKHHDSVLGGRLFLVILATSISTFCLGLLFVKMSSPVVYILDFIFCVFFAFVWSSIVKVPELQGHAARNIAVTIPSARENRVVFRFCNRIYADAFAKANDAKVAVRKVGKYGFGPNLFKGRGKAEIVMWSAVMSCIALFIGHICMVGERSHAAVSPAIESTKSGEVSSTEATSAPSEVENLEAVGKPTAEQIASVKSQLEDGRSKIDSIENELRSQGELIEALKHEMIEPKKNLQAINAQIDEGVDVDQESYKTALDEYNSLVRKTNSVIKGRKIIYAQYEALLKEDKRLVRQYNSLIHQ